MYLRPLLLLAVAGLLLLPDWSTARPGRRQVPAFASPLPCPTSFQYATPVAYAPPVYSAPVCCPPVYTPSSACPPATPAPKGPTVIPERMAEPRAADPKPPAVKGTSGDATAAPKPAPSVIRPVGNEDRLPPMQVPMAPPRAAEPQPAPPKPPAELAPQRRSRESR